METCRKRRIKCDESRPSCKKCTLTGRKCGGYGIWDDSPPARDNDKISIWTQKRPSYSIGSNLSLFPAADTSSERSALDHFERYMRTKLCGAFESQFWGKLILQASYQEPAILHSVIALSASQIGDDHLSLTAYSAAIKSLNRYAAGENPWALRITLITCMVFICLEQLKGSRRLAQFHLQSGLRMLEDFQTRRMGQCAKGKPSVLKVQMRPESADDVIIEAFTRLHVQSAYFGQGSSFQYRLEQYVQLGASASSMPRGFESLQDARQTLDWLMNTALALSSQAESLTCKVAPIPRCVRNKVKQLQVALREWKAAWEAGRFAMNTGLSIRDSLGTAVLSIYYKLTVIVAATCLRCNDETVFDAQLKDFESLLTEVQSLWNRAEEELGMKPANKMSFTVDLGFIPPLYYIALKCRDPRLRRRAIDLLRKAPHIEANWDGPLAATIAYEIMRLEEGDICAQHDLACEAGDGLSTIVPNSARVRIVDVNLDSDSRDIVTIRAIRFLRDFKDKPWSRSDVKMQVVIGEYRRQDET